MTVNEKKSPKSEPDVNCVEVEIENVLSPGHREGFPFHINYVAKGT